MRSRRSLESWSGRLKALETEGDPHVYRRIVSGGTFSQQERDEALALRREASAEFNRMADFDVLIAPTVAVTAPLIAEVESDFDRLNALILRNPTVFNFLDSCALSLPCHPRGEAPVGLMLAGAPFGDDALLSIGRAVEAVLETTR